MGKSLSCQIVDRIARIEIANPPVNALGQGLRRGLANMLDELAENPEVDALVLTGQGAHFCMGRDIREIEADIADNPAHSIAALCDRIDLYSKPIVAAVNGTAAAGGLELALAAHARIAHIRSQISFADTGFGVLPAGGATQRTPRLIGAKHALDMLLSGRNFPSRGGVARGLFDGFADDNLIAEASTLARRLADDPIRIQRSFQREQGLSDPRGFQRAIQQARADLGAGALPYAQDMIACVEASLLLPREAGLRFEAALHQDSLNARESHALRHAFFAEHRTTNMPEAGQTSPREIGQVGVVGGGINACGIVVASLAAGHPVYLFERNEETVRAAHQQISTLMDSAPIAKETRDASLKRLVCSDRFAGLAECDLIIEAVADNPQTKTQVFAALDQVAKPDAILVSNTMTLAISPIVAATKRPETVLGLHFHAPPHVNPLVEILPTPQTSAQSVVSATAFARGLNKVVIRCSTGGGTIGEHILTACRGACDLAVALGASPAQVDQAMRDWGFPYGVLAQLDLIGLDVAHHRARHFGDEPAVMRALVEAGDLGRKSGQGYFIHTEAADLSVSPAVNPAVKDHQRGGGGPDAAQIQDMCLVAMANAGARLLRAKGALRPSDIDAALVLGHGFPRHQGGPMKAADLTGLFHVLQSLRKYEPMSQALFAPDPGFAALVKNGENFDALNRVGRNRRDIPE